jgi:hypothetical protein
MTDLEQRLRRDLQWISQRAGPESIRPLRDPPARRRSRAVRWLAPVAAVVAVLGVVTGVSLASRSQGPQPASQRPVIPLEPAGPMPPYYVTAFQAYVDNGSRVATTAAVHDSATGATLTTVPIPTLTDSQGGTQGPSITAAADDRTFIITEQSDNPNVIRFYLLRAAANGRSAKLSRLPLSVPGYLSVSDVALSPDGRRLAMDVQHCNAKTESCPYTGVRVVTIATGAASTWTTRANGAPFNVSWAGDGRIAFEWQSGVRTPPPGQQTGYRLLSLAGPGRDLLAGRAIGSPAAEPTFFVPAALVTADGSIVITSTVQNIPEGHKRDTVVARVIELSASTGQLLRVLHTVTVRHVIAGLNGPVGQLTTGQLDQGCGVLSLGPVGVHVLVACFGFGRVDDRRFTPLPGFPSSSSSGISGQDASAW